MVHFHFFLLKTEVSCQFYLEIYRGILIFSSLVENTLTLAGTESIISMDVSEMDDMGASCASIAKNDALADS